MRSRLEDWDDRGGRARPRRQGSLSGAALEGAVAGLLGGAVMMLAMKGGAKALLPEGETMEPPPKKLVETLAEEQGIQISDTQAMAAGIGVHMGYSALWGALYGVVQSRLHPPDALHGLLLGGIVYAANFPEWGLLPKLGVLPPPKQQSLQKAALPLGAHVVFGLATAAAFRVLR